MRHGLLLVLVMGTDLFSGDVPEKQSVPTGGEVGVLAGVLWPDQALAGTADNSPRPALGLRGGAVFGPRWIWYIDGIHSTLDTETALGDATSYVGRMGLEWLPGRVKGARWFVTGAAGWMQVDYDRSATEDFHRPLVSAGFGQRIALHGRQHLRWELRYDVTVDDAGLGGEDLSEGLALVGWIWGPGAASHTRDEGRRARADVDLDGVRDEQDRCPDTAAGLVVDKLGCPPDTDGDGVADGLDRCARTAHGETVDATGCTPDADGDGVADTSDACPATPVSASVDEWGCPRDTDRDGVADVVDACAETPPGARVDPNGCPLDADGDGVYDGIDRCPASPPGSVVDHRGCPARGSE